MNIFLPYENDIIKSVRSLDDRQKCYTVYKHIFPNNKVYIGITRLPVEKRWLNGFGYKEINLVGKAIKKYGWENIKHEILFENLTKEEAESKEIELIAFYKSNSKEYGYNVQNGGNSKGKLSEKEIENIRERTKGNKYWLGKHHTEETKEKLRQLKIGKKLPIEVVEKIRHKNSGKKRSEAHRLALLNANLGKPCSKEKAEKISLTHKNNKPVEMLNANGSLIKEFYNISNASREIGVDCSSISRCCRGLQNIAGGYKWRYKNKVYIKTNTKPLKKVIQYDINNNVIKEYKSVFEACQLNDSFTEVPIRHCCRGISKTAYGYKWKYKED